MTLPMHFVTSPNCDDRPFDAVIDTIVLHYTDMKTAEEAIDRLCDRAAQVSAHYLVDEKGEIYRMVAEEDRAWHAGKSSWRGRERVNDVSIGIEIANPGHTCGYTEFPEAQVASVIALCKEIAARHDIPARNIIGHSDIAPDRKADPGELFPWEVLAEAGVGLWPEVGVSDGAVLLQPADQSDAVADVQKRLADYGYPVQQTGLYDVQTHKVVIAFQRHFHSPRLGGRLDGVWDRACDEKLDALIKLA